MNYPYWDKEEAIKYKLTAIMAQEGDGNAWLCPELDVASQGETVEQAWANLHEAVELFFECASQNEFEKRRSKLEG